MKSIKPLEYVRHEIPLWEKEKTIKKRYSDLVRRLFQPIRRIQLKIRMHYSSIKHRIKRHYHLHLMMKYEEKHWYAEAIFNNQDRRSKARMKVTGLFESLPRRLVTLHREMQNVPISAGFDARMFRGQYCKMVRTYRGLSREQTCRLLNSHKDILHTAKKHPSYWLHYPFTPEFLEKFEENTNEIHEEQPSFGWLPPMGFPTEAFAEWLSNIYCAKDEFAQFRVWYDEVTLKQNRNC